MNPEFRTPFERVYEDLFVQNLDGKHLWQT